MSGFVYIWTNIINNKKYIGSHKGQKNDGYIGSGVYFLRSYNKSPNNFIREIIYEGEDYRLVEEKLLIKLDVMNNNQYYNLKNSSIGGWEHTNNNDIILKRNKSISNSKKGKIYPHLQYNKKGIYNPMFGKKHNIETKIKIGERKIGKTINNKKIIELTENKIFNSVTEAAEYYGISQPTMSILVRNNKINRGKCKNKIFIWQK